MKMNSENQHKLQTTSAQYFPYLLGILQMFRCGVLSDLLSIIFECFHPTAFLLDSLWKPQSSDTYSSLLPLLSSIHIFSCVTPWGAQQGSWRTQIRPVWSNSNQTAGSRLSILLIICFSVIGQTGIPSPSSLFTSTVLQVVISLWFLLLHWCSVFWQIEDVSVCPGAFSVSVGVCIRHWVSLCVFLCAVCFPSVIHCNLQVVSTSCWVNTADRAHAGPAGQWITHRLDWETDNISLHRVRSFDSFDRVQ